jgi:hypothetical protein
MPSLRGNCDIRSMHPPDSMLASFSYTNSYDYLLQPPLQPLIVLHKFCFLGGWTKAAAASFLLVQ